jgi:hypothetical protein
MMDIYIGVRDGLPKIMIEQNDWEFKSERGKNLKQSIIDFNRLFKKYCDDYIGTDLTKEHIEFSIHELEDTLQIYCILTKQDFKDNFNWLVYNPYKECYYYHDHYRDVVLDFVKNADNFKSKRFWATYYDNLMLWEMDDLIRDFYFYSDAKKILYSKNYLELVKYDEFIIYKNEQFDKLNKEKHTQRNYIAKDKKAYILKDKNTGLYKIGRSSNPLDREKTLQAEKPTIKLIKIFKDDVERELHDKYNKQRVRGEWFNLNKVQLKYICTHY